MLQDFQPNVYNGRVSSFQEVTAFRRELFLSVSRSIMSHKLSSQVRTFGYRSPPNSDVTFPKTQIRSLSDLTILTRRRWTRYHSCRKIIAIIKRAIILPASTVLRKINAFRVHCTPIQHACNNDAGHDAAVQSAWQCVYKSERYQSSGLFHVCQPRCIAPHGGSKR